MRMLLNIVIFSFVIASLYYFVNNNLLRAIYELGFAIFFSIIKVHDTIVNKE